LVVSKTLYTFVRDMEEIDKNRIWLDQKYNSEHELYFKLISIHNVVKDWGLTPTQINILVYLIRLGFSKETKDIICTKLKISPSSLSTNLSYLRQGRVGNKKIKKLLDTSTKNMNITLLKQELKDIKNLITTGESSENIIAINFIYATS
jgi:hypothetical protein